MFSSFSGRIRIVSFGIKIMETSDNRTEGGHVRVTTGSALAVSTSKFKQRSVSAVRDFPPGYERATASNYGLLYRQLGTFCRDTEG
ncbi:hypothetical protein J1N35_014376 [Gossypium stocksii]|uniref:Uncharacterized protein n=1 Tax=Gossypium stocksii TaxID=47602 RepID=A0A9D3VUK9_9ROSI|nr:hypothetical protein J1N35_014376 [Gossypium stocksii]